MTRKQESGRPVAGSSLIGDGYFNADWTSTRLSVYRDPVAAATDKDGESALYSVELHLPPALHQVTVLWLWHNALENWLHHVTGDVGVPATEDYEKVRSEKFWLLYEFGAVKEPAFAVAARLSHEDLDELVFGDPAPVGRLLSGSAEGLDREVFHDSLADWAEIPESVFRIDPQRTGE